MIRLYFILYYMDNLKFHPFINYLVIFFGTGIGGSLRYSLLLFREDVFHYHFPLDTIIVNVVGSTLIIIVSRHVPQHKHWLFLTSGVLSGFTAFAGFCIDIMTIQNPLYLSLYIIMSILPVIIFKFLFLK